MMHPVGSMCWFDIPVTDLEEAKGFYAELLGWQFTAKDDDYLIIKLGNKMIGGMRRVPDTGGGNSPILFFVVEKLSSSIEKAKAFGVQTVGGVVQISSEEGCYQCLRDKDNNLFGLWSEHQ